MFHANEYQSYRKQELRAGRIKVLILCCIHSASQLQTKDVIPSSQSFPAAANHSTDDDTIKSELSLEDSMMSSAVNHIQS